jgi:hypothetical protein
MHDQKWSREQIAAKRHAASRNEWAAPEVDAASDEQPERKSLGSPLVLNSSRHSTHKLFSRAV